VRGRYLGVRKEGMICMLMIIRMGGSCRMERAILFSILIAFSCYRHVDNRLSIYFIQFATASLISEVWRGNEMRDDLELCGWSGCEYRAFVPWQQIFTRLCRHAGETTTKRAYSPSPSIVLIPRLCPLRVSLHLSRPSDTIFYLSVAVISLRLDFRRDNTNPVPGS
jgi:hypothetical protein